MPERALKQSARQVCIKCVADIKCVAICVIENNCLLCIPKSSAVIQVDRMDQVRDDNH